jgi:sialate O-acetylesterase
MKTKIRFIVTGLLLFACGFSFPQKIERLVNLKGSWKFSIGDDKNWAAYSFDDKNWETIRVPSSWENQGFHGYDGYAWYRKHFMSNDDLKGTNVTLKLGRIDDVDEVYLNGYLIGFSGSFPPDYSTAYNAWREYHIPEKYLLADKDNVIAVRVYDSQLEGGIVEGDIGIFEDVEAMKLDQDLSGIWKFNTDDDMNWKEEKINDKDWEKILVPGYWENQGYEYYDGFAWYRLSFRMDDKLLNKKLVLVLGKIDDIDEVYLNGKLIGSTGNMNSRPIRYDTKSEWQLFRGYFIPQDLLQSNKENVIAVRVYDGYRDGGIYQGPIGFIEQSKYTKFWRDYKPPKQKRSFWDWFFD